MFKSAIFYRLLPTLPHIVQSVETALHASIFTPCAPSQQTSSGWVPPRGEEHGALLESIGGHWILKLMTESKKVPSDVLRRTVDERVKAIETETGRKPGKKERRDIKEDAFLSLLPMAFATRSATLVWIDPVHLTLTVDASSQSKADVIVTSLVRSIEGAAVAPLNTTTAPTVAMAHWLTTQEPPQGFSVDRECELKATDESKAIVKYGRHPLDIDEVRQHVEGGKLPTRLAMTHSDRVSFVLTDALQLKKIQFLDVVFESPSGKDQDSFDADVAILTGELSKLIPDLVDALGGKLDSGNNT